MPKTKEEIKQYQKEYYKKNKERLRPLRQKYKEEHREEFREYAKEYLHNYYINNKERLVETIKQWTKNNKDKINAWRRQHNKDNKNKINELVKFHKLHNQIDLEKYYKINDFYIQNRFYSLLNNKIINPRLYVLRRQYYENNKERIKTLLFNCDSKEYLNEYKMFKKEISDMIENDPEYIKQCEDECNMISDDVFYIHKGALYTDWFERYLLND